MKLLKSLSSALISISLLSNPAIANHTFEESQLGFQDFEFVGNPINQSSGNKVQVEKDYTGYGVAPLNFIRTYNSKGGSRVGMFGENWLSTYDRSVAVSNFAEVSFVKVYRSDGKAVRFTLDSNGDPVVPANYVQSLVRLQDGQGLTTGWEYTDRDDSLETFNADGLLTSVRFSGGATHTLTYDTNDRLTTVTDHSGRTLTFVYNAQGRVSEFRDPALNLFTYSYNTDGYLSQVNYPDSVNRQYIYNEQINTSNTDLPHALTGLTDEAGNRFATWKYDTEGRATSSEHAGGVNETTLSYAAGSTTVTNVLGGSTEYTFSVIGNKYRTTAISNSGCACGSSSSSKGYDADGYMTSSSTFNGDLTTYIRDAKGRETKRTEPDNGVTNTTWHASLNKKTQVTGRGQTRSYTYDALGNVLTDTTTVGANSRVTTYTYNAVGQVTSVDGPRTSVTDTITLAYDVNYNLTSTTNALGHVTTYELHDAHGRPTKVTDPNGLVTLLAWDVRGRLTSETVGTRVTTFTYTDRGELDVVTLPDGNALDHTYDSAGRVIEIEDGHGSSTEYTLDLAGNITETKVYDSLNVLAYRSKATFDVFSRVTEILDHNDVAQSFTYDDGGNVLTITDRNGKVTTNNYDNMDRIVWSQNPLNEYANFTYNTRNQLHTVTDTGGAVTTYTTDAFGDVTKTVSKDSKTTNTTFDEAGNLLTNKLAGNKLATYTNDALNRPTIIAYNDGTAITYSYDSGTNGKGRLTAMTSPGGSTTYTYNQYGEVTQKSQTSNGVTLTVNYGYDLAGRRTNVTYPSGASVDYTYNLDQVTTISVGGVPIITAIEYNALGDFESATWDGTYVYSRTHDLSGRVITHGGSATSTLTLNALGQVTTLVNGQGTSTYTYDDLGQLTSYALGLFSETYTYVDGNRQYKTNSASNVRSFFAATSTGNRITEQYDYATSTSIIVRHDAAGGMTRLGSDRFTYDKANQMKTAKIGGVTTNYRYNGLGERIRKYGPAIPGTNQYFLFDAPGQELGQFDSTGTADYETIWLGNSPMGVISGGNNYFVETDHLNTPRSVLNTSDVAVWEWETDPWGVTPADDDPNSLGAFTFNLRFPGQHFDAESDLHYNYYRYYSPSLGRYIQSDPRGILTGDLDPRRLLAAWIGVELREYRNGLNHTYAYVDNDPLMSVDPSGENPLRILKGVADLYKGAKDLVKQLDFEGIKPNRKGDGGQICQVRFKNKPVFRIEMHPLDPEDRSMIPHWHIAPDMKKHRSLPKPIEEWVKKKFQGDL